MEAWFAAEAGTHVLRLIYSGLFDRFPRLPAADASNEFTGHHRDILGG
jgi:DNA-binding MarR family transcriptional regulator